MLSYDPQNTARPSDAFDRRKDDPAPPASSSSPVALNSDFVEPETILTPDHESLPDAHAAVRGSITPKLPPALQDASIDAPDDSAGADFVDQPRKPGTPIAPAHDVASLSPASGIYLCTLQRPHYPDVLGAWGPDGDRKARRHFAKLMAAAVEEITGRYPDYFSYFGIEVQSITGLARNCQSLPAFQQFCAADLERAAIRGIQFLDSLNIPINLSGAEETDEISMVLLQSTLDSYAAVHGLIPLNPPPVQTGCLVDIPNGRCAIEESPSGVRYILSKGEGRPLLIISTTGAPVRIWSTLLNDPDLRRPCLTIQSRAGSFLEGGTPNKSSLLQDVADIQEVLRAINLDRVDIVAWCNGSRPAIALAREEPERVASLMLVSPTFHGSMATEKYPSPFEDQLVSAYEIVINDEDVGRSLISGLTEPGMTEPGQLPRIPEKRVSSVLRLPPRAVAKDLLVPLSSIDYFKNYIDRVLGDETYDVRAALQEVRCPILLVTGTHDAAINTQLARDLLSTHGRDVLQVTISGAGHHIHLLQYSYFKYLLDTLAAGSLPVRTARLNVERLVRVQ